MTSLSGRYFRLLYNLRHHVWGDLPLSTWMILLLLVLAALFYFGVLPGGMALAVSMLALIVIVLMSNCWAKRRFYVLFKALDSINEPGSLAAFEPKDKVLVRATGEFAVEGDSRRFTDLLAYYRTFETREHAIMARKTPTRFLGLGRSRPEMQGMWYIFFRPEHLRTVMPGRLYFGAAPSPALRLNYVRFNKKGKAKAAVAYLGFETERSMQQVLADLLLDMGNSAPK
jgi:hypothetical protein